MAFRDAAQVTPGIYQRYDGMQTEVLYIARDIDTGVEMLVCRDGDYRVYTITMQSFLARVQWQGRFVTKYRPVKSQEQVAGQTRRPRQAEDYDAYAKDLCEYFAEDLRKYKLCVDQKQYFIPKEDFFAIKEDVSFLNHCLRTVLSPYNALFKGRFVDGLSIRKYAALCGKNRGSVDYEQKKLFAALARELQLRDEVDGKHRLAPKKQIKSGESAADIGEK